MKSTKNNFIELYLPLILFLISFIWKFVQIGARDICLDEPFTIFHAQGGIADIIKLPAQNEPNPPLFMLLLHFWIKLFGIGAHSVRSLPILFNALTAVILYFFGKRFFNLWSGITASGLFIFSTYHFYFGADTRTYAMISFATAAALYFLFAVLRNPDQKKYLLGLILSNLLLVYGHYFGWFVVFMEFGIGAVYFRNREVCKSILITSAATFVLFIPMFSVLIKQFFVSKENTWVAAPPDFEYLHQLQSFFNSRKGFRMLLYFLGTGLIVAFFSKIKKEQLKELTILVLWWLVPFTFMFLISSKIPIFTDRYVLFNSIGFYMFIGVATTVLFQKIKIVIPFLSLGLLLLMYWYMYTGDYAPRKVKMTAEYIQSNTDSNSALVISPYWADLGLMYYLKPEVFKSYRNYNGRLEEHNICRVWNALDTEKYLQENSFDKVILYQNNSAQTDPENSVFRYLNDFFMLTDSTSFHGGLKVAVFETKKPEIL